MPDANSSYYCSVSFDAFLSNNFLVFFVNIRFLVFLPWKNSRFYSRLSKVSYEMAVVFFSFQLKIRRSFLFNREFDSFFIQFFLVFPLHSQICLFFRPDFTFLSKLIWFFLQKLFSILLNVIVCGFFPFHFELWPFWPLMSFDCANFYDFSLQSCFWCDGFSFQSSVFDPMVFRC